jgi:hypothetical protein
MGICDPARLQTRTCILNVGLYRTGSTTLTQAAENTVLRVYHKFPDLNKEEHKLVLVNPREAVLQWWTQEAQEVRAKMSCLAFHTNMTCSEIIGLPSYHFYLQKHLMHSSTALRKMASRLNLL